MADSGIGRFRSFDLIPGCAPLNAVFADQRRRIDRRLSRRFAHFTERRKQHDERQTKQARTGEWTLQIRGREVSQVVLDEPPYREVRQGEEES